MLTRTANVTALPALVQDATALVDPSVMQKVLGSGGGGSGNASSLVSKFLGSGATPDIVSRLPSMIAPEGSLDLTLTLPFPHLVSLCFGGPGLADLYVATGGNAENPGKGGIVRLKTRVRGMAVHQSRLRT